MKNGKVLVATDGTSQSLGALRIARKLEERDGRRVEVVTVIEPVPIYDTGFMVALPEAELFEARRSTVEADLRDQMEQVTGSRTPWPLHVEPGIPASRIVTLADEVGADLIVVGVGAHGPMERIFGRETALQVIRLSHLPVLAVPEAEVALPNRAVLCVDFSTFSVRAAKAATALLRSPAELHLVHAVSGMEFVPPLTADWHPELLQQMEGRLADFGRDLGLPEGWSVVTSVREGEPAHEVLSYAEDVEADLLVVGSHGHSFVGRVLMGSVSTRLIRGARSAILVAPPEDRSHEADSEATAQVDAHPWTELLRAFTARNLGRRAEVEVANAEYGVQHSGTDLPFWGAVYEARANRLEIMLGGQGSVEQHLTHSIPGPDDVEVETAEDGRDLALMVRAGDATVILRFQGS